MKEVISLFNEFKDLFSEIKELSAFEVDKQGFIQPRLRWGSELFGYTQEDLEQGVNALELFIPEEQDKILRRLGSIVSDVKQKDREYIGRRKDGSTFPVLIYSKPVFVNKKVVGRRGIALDITEMKEIEKRLIESQEEMEKLMYTISHDLKSPLSSIYGFTELLKEENKDTLSESNNFYLERVSKNIMHMTKIIDDILEYSRIGQVKNDKRFHSLSGIINDVVLNFTPRLQEDEIEVKIGKDLPDVYVERKRFIQVFENLIDNAIKYMGHKKENIITIGKKEIRDEFIVVYIQDNGIGVKEEHLPKLFQLFTRIPNGFPNDVSGSGVGLANVKKIIKTHGGSIWVESEYKKGTTINLEIPLTERT